MKASVIECVHGFNSRLTWLLEEFKKVFGVRHEGIHGLLAKTALIDEVSEPPSDVAEVGRGYVLDVKKRRLALLLGGCGLDW